MQKTIEFLKSLCPEGVGKVEFNDAKRTMSFTEALEYKGDVYFLSAITDKNKRNGDDDIVFKNYFVVDFDVRSNFFEDTKEIADDDVLMMGLGVIKDKLSKAGYGDYRYIVASGNGFHFYYVGVGDKFEKAKYSAVVNYHYLQIDSLFSDKTFRTDKACKNIGRIMRLPGTTNYKRQIKYKLEPSACEILEDTGTVSEKILAINQTYDFLLEMSVIEEANRQIKNLEANIDDPVYDEINKLPIEDLVKELVGLELKPDKKNFSSPKDGSNIGMFLKDNVIYHTGTHYIKDKYKGYNCFTFIREHKSFDNKETFEWFKDKYHQLKDHKQQAKQIQTRNLSLDYSYKLPFTRGLDCLDKKYGKFDKHTFNIIVGESGSGKTEYTFFEARQNAKYVKVCYISLEMKPEKLVLRYAMKRAGVTPEQYSNRTLIQEAQKIVMNKHITDVVSMGNLKIVGYENPFINDIERIIKDYYTQGFELFFIDNLGFIVGNGDENEYVKEASRKLKVLTNKLPISINLIHHFKKGTQKEREKPRGVADMRSSGKLENDADNIVHIWRNLNPDEQEYGGNEVVFGMMKNRELGVVGTFGLKFEKGTYAPGDILLF